MDRQTLDQLDNIESTVQDNEEKLDLIIAHLKIEAPEEDEPRENDELPEI